MPSVGFTSSACFPFPCPLCLSFKPVLAAAVSAAKASISEVGGRLGGAGDCVLDVLSVVLLD